MKFREKAKAAFEEADSCAAICGCGNKAIQSMNDAGDRPYRVSSARRIRGATPAAGGDRTKAHRRSSGCVWPPADRRGIGGLKQFSTSTVDRVPVKFFLGVSFAIFCVLDCGYAQDIGRSETAAWDLPQNGGQTLMGGPSAAGAGVRPQSSAIAGATGAARGNSSRSPRRGKGLLRAIDQSGAVAADDRSRCVDMLLAGFSDALGSQPTTRQIP